MVLSFPTGGASRHHVEQKIDLALNSGGKQLPLLTSLGILCFAGDARVRGQTGVLSERRGSYPFIDFRLLNSKCNPSFATEFKKHL